MPSRLLSWATAPAEEDASATSPLAAAAAARSGPGRRGGGAAVAVLSAVSVARGQLLSCTGHRLRTSRLLAHEVPRPNNE